MSVRHRGVLSDRGDKEKKGGTLSGFFKAGISR